MKAGSESVWLVVPFTVGIAIVKYSSPLLYKHPLTAVAALVAALAAMALCIIGAWRHALRDGDLRTKEIWLRRLVLVAMFFLTGVAVCLLANLPDLIGILKLGAEGASAGGPSVDGAEGLRLGEMVRPSRLRLFINGCGERFRAMIDSMPFRDGLSNALLKALLAGDRSSLPWDVRNSFRNAGASHLLALSGLHLSVIYLVISRILSVTGNFPAAVKARSILIVLFSGFFTLITGASPSLVRAFLFITLRECAVFTRRRTANINIFCMSLMLQLTLNPNDIASVGFQLSYLAMLGIFLIDPPLERFWDFASDWLASLRKTAGEERGTAFGTAMRKIWSLCALSISCQVLTAPAVLLYFGTFPTYFLLTNLLCLPLSNVLITVSVIAVLLQMLGLCPAFLLSVIDFLVHTLTGILDIIAGM